MAKNKYCGHSTRFLVLDSFFGFYECSICNNIFYPPKQEEKDPKIIDIDAMILEENKNSSNQNRS